MSQAVKQHILRAAMIEAGIFGYQLISRESVAASAEVSPALVSFYFGTMPKLRQAVMHNAVRLGHLRILAQGIVSRHPAALGAPKQLRQAAVDSLMTGWGK